METDYMKRLMKRLNERRAMHSNLASKYRLLWKTKREIKELEDSISALDDKISVLTPLKR